MAVALEADRGLGNGARRGGARSLDDRPHEHLADAVGNRAMLGLLHSGRLGTGRPLDSSVRADMQVREEQDFSDVRVHDDAVARSSARALGVRAFTAGRDIIFGGGEYAPRTAAGREVLAHELSHVAEQRGREPVVQCMKMGTGTKILHGGTDAEATALEPPDIEKARVQGAIDRVKAIADHPELYAGCHSFFKDRSATGETLNSAFDRAVVWKNGSTREGAGASAFPGEENILYTADGFALGEAKLAEQLLHELGHVAGIGLPGSRPHGAADEIRVACMAGASTFFRFRGGVDTRRNALASIGLRWLLTTHRRRGELRAGLDLDFAGMVRALEDQGEPGEIGSLSLGYGRRLGGGERWGGLTLYGELGIGGARFRLRNPDPGDSRETVLGPGLVLEIGARKEFFVRDVQPEFAGRQTGAGISISYRPIIPLTGEAADVMHGFYIGFDWSWK
jgi:hypothetical protein